MAEMSQNRTGKIEVLDMIIAVLQDHEKTLDSIAYRLSVVSNELTMITRKLDARTETMLKYYEPIEGK